MSVEQPVASAIPSPRRAADRGIYTWAALASVIIVFAGFARSYYLKSVFGAPELTTLVHVHGLVMTLWFSLFVVQVRLVATHRIQVHKRLGYFGAALAVAVLAIGTLTAITAAKKGATPGPPPLVFLTIPLGDMVVFATLVSLGLGYRNRPAIHKRLLLLSSLGILTAAIARIPIDALRNAGLPAFFAVTDVIILACILIDTTRNRRLHPALGWGFLFIIASQVTRFAIAGTPQWLAFAKWLTG
jgi:hypothetical protein